MIPAIQTSWQGNPFPGLRPFEPDEDHLFFGRERQVDELLRRLRTTRFLAILGTSGCGKSSLVRSGLIPSLHGGAMTRAGSSWRVAILRPGEDPIGNLAAALDAPDVLQREEGADDLSRSFLETTLRASNQGLAECIRHARIPPRDNVLVLVDQFEELFRFRQSRKTEGRDEAVHFAKLLLAAAHHRETPVYVALTMRSDFIGNCLELPGLPEAINEGLYLVPRMTRDELRAAITGPVAVGGGAIAPRLVSRLLNDIGDDPDQLPILQHALLRTWRCWTQDHSPGEPLDLRHYEAIGTMTEALSLHAEKALAELDKRGRSVVEVLLKALTETEADGRGIRRPVSVAQACALTGASPAEIEAVTEPFRRPGRSFLMPPAGVPLRADSVVDISHESLMRVWDRLRQWVQEEARSAQIYKNLARAAASHAEGVAALWRDPELQIALQWRQEQRPGAVWAARYDPSFERAMRFLEASSAERDHEIAERDKRRRRTLRNALIVAAALGAAALATLVFAIDARHQEKRAETERIRAEEEKREAENQRVKAVQESARAQREERNAELQRQRALHQKAAAETAQAEAVRESQRAEEQSQRAEQQKRIAEAKEQEARTSEAAANRASREAEARRKEAQEEKKLADAARSQAVTSEKETRRLGRLAAARALALQVVRPQQEDQRELSALLALQAYRLNRENQGEAEDPDLFHALRASLGRLRPDPILRGHEDGVRAVAVAPDGQTLISGGEDGKLLRFDLGRPAAPPAVLGTYGSGVRSLALGAGGRSLAAGFADGALRLWDLSRPGSPPRELAAGGAVPGALAFAPKGSALAAGRADGTVSLFDLARPDAPPTQLDGKGRRIASLTVSPDGRTLAAGLAPGGALLWPLPPATATPRTACDGKDVRSVAFSPDGRTLACGAARGEITLLDLASGNTTSLLGHASSINSLSFNPQGSFLASASSDKTLRLWNVQRPGSQPVVLAGHDSWVWSAAFSPDGGRLVSGSEDKTVRVWMARTDLLAEDLCRTVHRGLTHDEWSRHMPADLAYRAEPPCPVTR